MSTWSDVKQHHEIMKGHRRPGAERALCPRCGKRAPGHMGAFSCIYCGAAFSGDPVGDTGIIGTGVS